MGIPGFFLALEKSRERIRGHFLQTVIRRALPGGVAVAVCATLAMLMTHTGWEAKTCSTVATWIAGLVGLMALARVSWPFDTARGCIMAGSAILFTLSAFLFGHVFLLVRLQGMEWAVLGGLAAMSAGFYVLTALGEKRFGPGREKKAEG